MQINLLAKTLKAVLADAASRSLMKHADDPIYGYGLYTSLGYSYVSDCVFTEGGLREVVEEYQARNKYSSHSEAVQDLRWSPCDSPFQLENESSFLECSKILGRIWNEASLLTDEEGDRIYREIHEVFIHAIMEIRDTRRFPKDCVFSLFAGDQSDAARLVNAERLNPPDLCARFHAELAYVDSKRLDALRANRWPTDDGYEA